MQMKKKDTNLQKFHCGPKSVTDQYVLIKLCTCMFICIYKTFSNKEKNPKQLPQL